MDWKTRYLTHIQPSVDSLQHSVGPAVNWALEPIKQAAQETLDPINQAAQGVARAASNFGRRASSTLTAAPNALVGRRSTRGASSVQSSLSTDSLEHHCASELRVHMQQRSSLEEMEEEEEGDER